MIWFSISTLVSAPLNPTDSIFNLFRGSTPLASAMYHTVISCAAFITAMDVLELLAPRASLPSLPSHPYGAVPAAATEALISILVITSASSFALISNSVFKRLEGVLLALVIVTLKIVEGGSFSGAVGNPAAALSLSLSTLKRMSNLSTATFIGNAATVKRGLLVALARTVAPTAGGCVLGAACAGMLFRSGKASQREEKAPASAKQRKSE